MRREITRFLFVLALLACATAGTAPRAICFGADTGADTDVETDADTDVASAQAQQPSALDLGSTQNTVLVVTVGMPDGDGKIIFNACDVACIQATMWGDVQRVFAASSLGAFGFAAPPASAVVAVVLKNEPLMQAECHLADRWFHAAAALAGNVSAYTVRVYLYPPQAGAGTCTAGGFSNVGCSVTDCNSWLRGFGAALVVHEVGHLLGFSHAAWDVDGNGVVEAAEASADLSDPMTSVGALRLFHAPNRMRAKWLTCGAYGFPAVPNKIALASTSALDAGALQEQPQGKPQPQPQPQPQPPAVLCQSSKQDPGLVIVVSGRTPVSVDAGLGPQWAPAVYMHRVRVTTGQAVLLGVARVGETVQTNLLGTNTTLTLVAAPATGPLMISFAKCVRAGPLLAAQARGLPGARANVTVTVTNRDMYCPARTLRVKDVSAGPGQPSLPCVNVTVILRKDNQPIEMSWDMVRQADGAVLVARTPYTSPGPTQEASTMVCGGGGAVVRFFDSYGDGYCCAWGPGGYTVAVNGRVVATGGQFGFNTTVPIPAEYVWSFPSPVLPGRSATTWGVLINIAAGTRLTLAVADTATYVS